MYVLYFLQLKLLIYLITDRLDICMLINNKVYYKFNNIYKHA